MTIRRLTAEHAEIAEERKRSPSTWLRVLSALCGYIFVFAATAGTQTAPTIVVDLVTRGFYDGQRVHRLADRPDLNGKYTVFGRVVAGADVPARLDRGDVITKMYVRD